MGSRREDTRMQPGPEQLKDWMERRRFNQRETAAHFDWDETFVSALLNGRRSPGLSNALRIERETGIPVEAWASSELSESVEAGSAKARKRAS